MERFCQGLGVCSDPRVRSAGLHSGSRTRDLLHVYASRRDLFCHLAGHELPDSSPRDAKASGELGDGGARADPLDECHLIDLRARPGIQADG